VKNSHKKIKLVYITTIPDTIRAFLKGGHIELMKASGFEVVCVSSPGEKLDDVSRHNDIEVIGIEMTRKGLTPITDLKGLVSLYLFFRRYRPDIVNMSTPKAAFLSSMAAWLARVPVRIYLNRGVLFVNFRGLKRLILKMVDRIPSLFCHQTIFVSKSLKEFAIQEGTVSNRFDPDRSTIKEAALAIVKKIDIPAKKEGAMVIGFVGRLERDKGISELLEIWERLKDEYPNIYLLLVGPWDMVKMTGEGLEIKKIFDNDNRVVQSGFVEDVAPYYTLMDILLFPSHREGFPNVPMEAVAMEVPVVASNVVGCVDAVVNGETGFLVPKGDVDAFIDAVIKLLNDTALRRKFGKAGRERCIREFSPQPIWEALIAEYMRLLKLRG
jgi:glycosyltransferase involved in cell wall biosynthesis